MRRLTHAADAEEAAKSATGAAAQSAAAAEEEKKRITETLAKLATVAHVERVQASTESAAEG
jgi:hypothetical protein